MNFLIGACQAKTIFLHHFEAIKNLIINTINLDEKLYNYKPEAIIKLMNNALKAGIILQSLNCKNIDSATLNSLALSQINNDSKIHPAYYKVISSLFFV